MNPSNGIAWLRIIRPLNIILTFGSVALGGWLAVGRFPSDLTLAGLSASLIAAAGYIHNDVVDLPVDRISHPRRVLPNAEITVKVAWVLAMASGSAGFALSLLLSPYCIVVSALSILLLATYNLGSKRLPMVGNIVVAIVGGVPFIFGGLAVGNPSRSVLPAAFATVFHLGREILKDIQDQPGDSTVGNQSLSSLIGDTGSKAVVTAILSLLVIGIPLPSFWGLTGPVYLSIGLCLNALILLAICQLWGSRSPEELEKPSRLLKLGMVVGIAAFLADSLLQ